MRTRLQSHIHSRPGWLLPPLTTVLERRALRVQSTQLSMKPLADHHPVPHNHRANKRIRTHPTPPALGKDKGALQETSLSC
jgi:hypothetical protein